MTVIMGRYFTHGFFFFLFFPAYSKPSQTACLPYFHTWGGLSVNIFPTRPHNMVNFGPLMAEIISLVWGTPANFSRFHVLASLLHRSRSTDVNQTLHDVYPSPVLVHYIYISGGSCPVTEIWQVQNSLCVQILRFPIFAALLHSIRAVGVSQTAVFSRESHLYLAGRPSRWASAHILVVNIFFVERPLPSNRHHRSNGECLEGKRENYQVCSVQHCVQQLCTVQCRHILWTDLTVLWIGFCLTGPISLCLD